jgi:EmrB/QacA subfamily drug resistance transporter
MGRAAAQASGTRGRLIAALSIVFMLSIANGSMVRVALPTIRARFAIAADVTAWLDTAYQLAYLSLIPLYGRLADLAGKRRLFLSGLGVFFAGTVLMVLAPGLGLLFAGRIIQGAGNSGIHPLCIAVITDRFAPEERGKALGQWNSWGTVAAMAGPFIGGLLIDALGWRATFAPLAAGAIFGLFVIWRAVPAEPARRGRIDWAGLALFAAALTLLLFYVSSRPITGVSSLRDARLGAGAAAAFALFVLVETKVKAPLVDLRMLRFPNFTPASLCSGVRMLLMSSFDILVPLMLTEVYGLPASAMGLIVTSHYVFLLVTMRLGGVWSDRGATRVLVAAGALLQTAALAFLGLPGAPRPLGALIAALAVHGLGAGVYLAPVHRAAMASVPRTESGAAAGLYSVLRYGGSLLGPAISGVIVEARLAAGAGGNLVPSAAAAPAYQAAMLAISLAGVGAVALSFAIRENAPATAASPTR